jgi:hypothetical protein
MGMIFNSANTLAILEELDGRYSSAELTQAIRQHDIGVSNDATSPDPRTPGARRRKLED